MIRFLLGSLAFSLVIACASAPPKPVATTTDASGAGASTNGAKEGAGAAAKKSLYDRLGGLPAITAVVDDFVGNCAADTRIQARFALTDIKDLKQKLVDQVCAATGGPCTYKGGDMKSVHKNMRIKGAEFDALVEDLVKSLDKFKVPAQEKGELLGALGSMRGDIVEAP